MTTTNEVSNLNKDQLAAAHCTARTIVCSAPPGAGKTATLVERIRWLIRNGAEPQDIAAITFTTAGAKELSRRLDGVRLGVCSTLHAYLLKLLQRHGSMVGLPPNLSVMDEETATESFTTVLKELRLADKFTEAELAAGVVKMRPLGVQMKTNLEVAAARYHAQMRETGELDYDAILDYGERLVKKQPNLAAFQHLLIDEGQDNSKQDWNVYSAMPQETLFIVGDGDQSVYQFRGAAPEIFVAMTKSGTVEVCPLQINYRSGDRLVAATQQLIRNNKVRISTPSIAHRSGGTITVASHETPAHELAFITAQVTGKESVAVLWRTNPQVAKCREHLQGLGIKVATQRAKKQDAAARAGRAALCFMANPWSDSAALRWLKADTKTDVAKLQANADAAVTSVAGMVNAFVCDIDVNGEWDLAGFTKLLDKNLGFGLLSHQWLLALAATMPDTFTLSDLMAASMARTEETEGDGIVVSTAHASKGREWDLVIVAGLESETWNRNPAEEEAERRLAYVAMTRARDALVLSWCRTRPAAGRPWLTENKTASKFIAETGCQ